MPYRLFKKKAEKKKLSKNEEETFETNSVLFQKSTLIDDPEKKVIRVTKEGKVVAKYEEMR